MPLLAILAAGAVTHALSSDFEYLYPLRAVAGGSACFCLSSASGVSRLALELARPGLAAPLFFAFGSVPRTSSWRWLRCPQNSRPCRRACAAIWIVGRLAGGVCDRAGRRGAGLSGLSDAPIDQCGLRIGALCSPCDGPPLQQRPIMFGLMHGAMWLPGIAAGWCTVC